MTNQIFKKNVPSSFLFDLLEKICFKTNAYYLIDINAYKKFIFYQLNEDFSKEIIDYYHLSKQFYATRKMTYKSFVNIVRQICKNANIMYTSQMKYNESEYNIDYNIYYV